jgi:hypothetical protein
LVQLALELTNIEKVWIEMAIAQRVNAKASIEASIRYYFFRLQHSCTALIVFATRIGKKRKTPDGLREY